MTTPTRANGMNGCRQENPRGEHLKRGSTRLLLLGAVVMLPMIGGGLIGYWFARGTQQDEGSVSLERALAERRERSVKRSERGVVADARRGLEWLILDTEPLSFDKAVELIDNLSVAGGGWRLPTFDEVAGLSEGAKSEVYVGTVWTSDIISPERQEAVSYYKGTKYSEFAWDSEGHMCAFLTCPILWKNVRERRSVIYAPLHNVLAVRGGAT